MYLHFLETVAEPSEHSFHNPVNNCRERAPFALPTAGYLCVPEFMAKSHLGDEQCQKPQQR